MALVAPPSIARTQDRLLRLLGSHPDKRASLVAGMLRRDGREATSYWLQLVIALGIATLGLVVGSSAVVIAAMLVAPLMGPIIGLAMGLAAGSPFLVLRSAGRVALSVAIAVGAAALITRLIPFHELNEEIASRAAPTVLDLLIAAFCALAGVYASLRPASETATTAAGTSIGVSLLPPLCASGYGIGTQEWSVAGGAAMLFLTNFVAIIGLGTLSYLAAGFTRVNVAALERAELAKEDEDDAPIARYLARRLATVFESRFGPALRFLMPFVLVGALYVPLQEALDEVAWQHQVRSGVGSLIDAADVRVVQSRVRVERHSVDLVLVMVGSETDAERMRAHLDGEIRRISGVVPRIEVLAIPDARAFAGLESTLLKPQPTVAPAPAPPPDPDKELDAVRARVAGAARTLWPAGSAGPALSIDLSTQGGDPLVVRIHHLGRALDPAARESLARGLGKLLDHEVIVDAREIEADRIDRSAGDAAFLARLAAGIRESRGLAAVHLCVTAPPPARPRSSDARFAETLTPLLRTHPRSQERPGDEWSAQFRASPCQDAPSLP